jgi:cytokinin dehydrogenase
LYEEPERLLSDMQRLAARPGIDHIEAFCSASMQGLALGASGKREPFVHWLYGLHVSSEFEPPAEPLRREELLDGISPWRVLRAEQDDSNAFAARYDARFEVMRRTGGWAQPHPWFECMLPLASAADLIPKALSLLPVFLGDGHRVLLVSGERRPQALAMPAGEPVVGFAVLPQGVPEALRGPTLAALQRVEALLLEAGGKRYLSGYLDQMDERKWRAHYGDRYDDLARAKSTLDPNGIFESCLSQPR